MGQFQKRYGSSWTLHTTSRYLARLEGEQDPGWQVVAQLLGREDEHPHG